MEHSQQAQTTFSFRVRRLGPFDILKRAMKASAADVYSGLTKIQLACMMVQRVTCRTVGRSSLAALD